MSATTSAAVAGGAVNVGHGRLVAARVGRSTFPGDAPAETSGALTGLYGPEYLDGLRHDWPA